MGVGTSLSTLEMVTDTSLGQSAQNGARMGQCVMCLGALEGGSLALLNLYWEK